MQFSRFLQRCVDHCVLMSTTPNRLKRFKYEFDVRCAMRVGGSWTEKLEICWTAVKRVPATTATPFVAIISWGTSSKCTHNSCSSVQTTTENEPFNKRLRAVYTATTSICNSYPRARVHLCRNRCRGVHTLHTILSFLFTLSPSLSLFLRVCVCVCGLYGAHTRAHVKHEHTDRLTHHPPADRHIFMCTYVFCVCHFDRLRSMSWALSSYRSSLSVVLWISLSQMSKKNLCE